MIYVRMSYSTTYFDSPAKEKNGYFCGWRDIDMEIDLIFDRLWRDYSTQNPSARKVKALFHTEGEDIQNDHVAFRTLNDPRINLDVLSRIFLRNGYEKKGSYRFGEKHLAACHFEHKTEPSAPKVFISELVLQECSPFLQETMNRWVDLIPEEILNSDEIIFAGSSWTIPSFSTYEALRRESEYAAWLYVYGFRANHFTVNLNHFRKYNTVEAINSFLKDHGFRLNTIGGEIKGTPADLLMQSSTMADIVTVPFLEGAHDIPACYYEFARRYPDSSGQLYSGFLEKSANKIFESTDYRKS